MGGTESVCRKALRRLHRHQRRPIEGALGTVTD